MSDREKERQAAYKKYNLDPNKIPKHVAIIMDGNGRWAKRRLMPRNVGHKAGSEALRKTIKACVELGITVLTVYVFSTENWKRPPEEVRFLMKLLKELLIKEVPVLNKEGAGVKVLGDIDELDPELQNIIKKAEESTKENQILTFNLMINYGSQREIISAVKAILADIQNGKKLEITEAVFDKYLYTKDCPDPEILIRTGGDRRVSNYLLWQIAYSELFFLDTLWPDFNREELIKVVKEFQKRERRYGGLN
ncbi:isoprenyl transferase [Candidatus Margulisiibacteriota bacterium]